MPPKPLAMETMMANGVEFAKPKTNNVLKLEQRLSARAQDRIVNISLVLQAKLRVLAPGLAPWHLFCAPQALGE